MAQSSIIVNSFQGYHGGADCSVCHNEPATAWNDTFSEESISADGVGNEFVWEEEQTFDHTMYIPVAGSFGSSHIFVRTQFAQNTTHLFMKLDWSDLTLNGTTDNKYDPADGLSIYWEMGDVAYDQGFGDGMKTESGTLDVWTWKAAPMVETLGDSVNLTATYASVDSEIDHDYIMNNVGLVPDGEQDVTMGATYGNLGSHHEDSYQVEIIRALETGKDSDIQFNASGYYSFGLAIFNDTSGSDHLMGFSHDVWIYAGPPEDNTSGSSDTPIVGFLGLTLIALTSVATVFAIKRRK